MFACNAIKKSDIASARGIVRIASRSMPFAFAKTGFTIVRTAARHARFTWWITKQMLAEFRATELKMTSDPRLRAGVRAALEHICERDGLGKNERHELAAAVENECRNVLEDQREQCCTVTIDELGDRIEVSVGPATEQNARESNLRKGAAANFPQADSPENRFHAEMRNPAGRAQNAARNDRAATLVRHFHKKPAHT